MSSSDNYYIEIFDNTIAYIYRYGNPVIYILGNIGNLLTAIVFFKNSWRKNVCVFYFKICLLLSSVYLNSTILGFTLLIGFDVHAQNSSVILCKLFYYLSSCISTLLPTVLILASIDRLLISSQNVNRRLYTSKHLAYVSVILSILFWFFLNFHILVKVNLQKSHSSILRCYYGSLELYYDYIYNSLAVIDVLFCLTMFILCIFSFKTVCHRQIIPLQQRVRIRLMTQTDFQLLRCLYVHNIMYIMCSIFSATYSIYTGATQKQIRSSLNHAMCNFFSDLFTFIGFIFYCVSFFIFFTISKAFRRELKRMVYKVFGKNVTSTRKKNSYQQDQMQTNVELNVIVNSTIASPI